MVHGSDGFGEMEMELEFEGMGAFEGEGEFEFESGMPEAFGLGDISNWASNQWTAVKTPGSWQNNALRNAYHGIVKTGGAAVGKDLGSEVGGLLGPEGAVVGGVVGGAAGGYLADQWANKVLPDKEYEWELEGEFEGEFGGLGMVNPVARMYPDAMVEHLGRAAMEAESEMEAAEHFLPLIPMLAAKVLPMAARLLPRVAGKVVPHVARVITRVTPHMTRGVTQLTRTLHRDPRSRPLLRVVPTVARRAVTQIARQAATGRPVPPQRAVHILARENHRVLSNPQAVHRVLNHVNRLDRRLPRIGGVPVASPTRRMGPPAGHYAGYAPGLVGIGTVTCPTCGRPTVVRRGRTCCCC